MYKNKFDIIDSNTNETLFNFSVYTESVLVFIEFNNKTKKNFYFVSGDNLKTKYLNYFPFDEILEMMKAQIKKNIKININQYETITIDGKISSILIDENEEFVFLNILPISNEKKVNIELKKYKLSNKQNVLNLIGIIY
jgi:hypothetical protein